MKVVLDSNALQNINVFQSMTSANVMDCMDNSETIYFVVKGGGWRNPEAMRRMERIFGKRVRIYEFSEDPKTFIRRLAPDATEISIESGIAKIKVRNCFKPRIIGKDKSNLMIIKSLLKRFYEIEDVKII
jgi:N utilization substance protein A